MHSVIKKTDNTILYQVTPGKPDPKEMAQETGEMRGRVVQKASQSPVCWYFVLNFLRKRIGPEHTESLKEARHIERTISLARKNLIAGHNEIPTITESLEEDLIKKTFKTIDQQSARENTANWQNSFYKVLDDAASKIKNYRSFHPSLRAFAQNPQNSPNFFEYLITQKRKRQLNSFQNGLESLGIDFKKKYEELIMPLIGNTPFDQLEYDYQFAYMQYIFQISAAEKYNLQTSSWKPTDGYEKLKESLVKHGPHYFAGGLGNNQYYAEPYKLETSVGNRSIWGWKSGTKKPDNEKIGHVVLVVGAQEAKNGKFIYYIDPEDGSDPKDLEKQKIYVTSYSNFETRISNLAGMTGADAQKRDLLPYAIHA